MTVDDRTAVFISSLDSGNIELLDRIEREALEGHIPVIRKETQSFLKFLLRTVEPENILEIGTAVGFSAILMAEYGPKDCRVTTIENYGKRIPVAQANIRRAGLEGRVSLIEGDAGEVLQELSGPYDFIFLDAAKGQYLSYLPQLFRLLSPGGVLMSDNVLKGGEIIESRFAVERRNRTIHARMRRFLYELAHWEGLTASVLPLGDGVAVAVRGAGGT